MQGLGYLPHLSLLRLNYKSRPVDQAGARCKDCSGINNFYRIAYTGEGDRLVFVQLSLGRMITFVYIQNK